MLPGGARCSSPATDSAWRCSGRRSCRAITVRTVRRTDHLQRSAYGAVQGITYGLAVLLGALGGFLDDDNRSGVAAGDRLWDGKLELICAA